MDDHIEDLLPFYINCTLSDQETARLDAHLAACPACRARLAEWAEVSELVKQAASRRPQGVLAQDAPRLSPLMVAALKCRPSFQQAVSSAAQLIWAQRVFLGRGWLWPLLAGLMVFGVLGALLLQRLALDWANIPLIAIAPIAAVLSTAFLYTFEDDPACEIIAAAPTSLGTLLFARLTLALGAISLLGLLGSLLQVVVGWSPHSFFDLVGAWLGPMLLLSALTTALSLCVHPTIACGAALALWGSVLMLLFAVQAGARLVSVPLLWLLQPGWALLAGEVLLAGLLWLASWLWLAGNAPAALRPEG